MGPASGGELCSLMDSFQNTCREDECESRRLEVRAKAVRDKDLGLHFGGGRELSQGLGGGLMGSD